MSTSLAADMRLLFGAIIAAAAILAGGAFLAGHAAGRAATPPAEYRPCEPVAEGEAPDRRHRPELLPCPPVGSSEANPVLADTPYGPRLAYFERGAWREVGNPHGGGYLVWAWRWPK